MRTNALVAAAIAAALTAGAAVSHATTPGRNGRLVYQAQAGRHLQLFSVPPAGGTPRQLTHLPDSDALTPAWSPDGSRIAFARDFAAGVTGERLDIATVAADGKRLRTMGLSGLNGEPTWSPDGSRILFVHTGGLALVARDGGGLQQFEASRGARSPTFSPDGKRIAFWRAERGGAGLYIARANATTPQRVRFFPGGLADKIDWSPDGSRIALSSPELGRPGRSANVYTVRPDGTGLTRLTHDTGGTVNDGLDSWSPDGRQIAFVSNRAGTYTLYRMNADGSYVRQVTTQEAHLAAWGTHP